MAAIFDKIISGVSKGVENVSTSSKTVVEKAKINTYINNLENEKKQLAEYLGIKVYNLYIENKLSKEEIEGFCNEITNRNKLISEQKKKLEELESIKHGDEIICKCGYVNISDSKYCAKCGTALQNE